MKHKFSLLVSIFLILSPWSCFAGAFKVVPVRITMEPDEKTSIVTIKNVGNEKVTIQLSVKTWNQDENGREKYQDTKDILFFPKIASISKDGQQIIRLGYQGKETPAVERTYRLFVEELPVRNPGDKELKFVLRMIIPVFISPRVKTVGWSIEKSELTNGILRVKVKNGGNAHIATSKIDVTGKDENDKEVFFKEISGGYILANSSRYHTIEIPQADCLKTRTLNVAVDVEKSVIKTELKVDKSMCAHE